MLKPELIQLIESHDVISFDIFNTLIHRLVDKPDTTFTLIEYKLRKSPLTLTYPFLGTSFAYTRKEAERVARTEREKFEGDSEVTFDEIYTVFQDMLGLPQDVIDQLQDLEIQVEIQLLYPDPEMQRVFDFAKTLKKKIILCSDMYLPTGLIQALLTSCKYDVSDIPCYVSCEYRKNKHTGTLFNVITEKYSNILHIGDNERSDKLNADLNGLTGYHYDYKGSLFPLYSYSSSPIQSIINGVLIKQYLAYDTNTPQSFLGTQIYGPVITGSLIWLLTKIQNKSYDHILFFARDGEIGYTALKRHADRLDLPPFSYVYISRAAITLPTLYDLDIKKLPRMISGTIGQPVREWLKLYGINNPALIIREIQECDLSPDTIIISGDPRINLLLQKIYPAILEASTIAREEALQYFKQFAKNKVAVVDLGWLGSIQQNATKLLTQLGTQQVDGYYFNLWNLPDGYSRASLHDNYFAYIRDHSNEMYVNIPKLLQEGGVELLEDVFSGSDTETHGTTLGYFEGAPILEDSTEVVDLSKLRAAALSFFDTVFPLLQAIGIENFDSLDWTSSFFRMVEFPTKEEVDILGDIQHCAAAGLTENALTSLAPILEKDILIDKEAFKAAETAAYWKQGFKLRNKRITKNRKR